MICILLFTTKKKERKKEKKRKEREKEQKIHVDPWPQVVPD